MPDIDSTQGQTTESSYDMETGVIRALAGAIDDLLAAKDATRIGFLADHIDNAILEVRKAMRLAVDGTDA